ncbi:MAG: glutaredoxin family protein [Candidatus Methanoperedenaceae archaeon]|nr:glutaredoxin family protein [Candidatus Methanoperedenaceae archaeon]
MPDISIYSTGNCPNCRVLKQSIKEMKLEFEEVDMATPEALTELRMNGVFTMAAPVLQVDDEFYTYNELFTMDRLDTQKLERLLKVT